MRPKRRLRVPVEWFLLIVVWIVALPPDAGAGSNPPVVVIDEARATGPVVNAPNGAIEYITIEIGESPLDTVPAHSRLDFRWHAVPSPGSHIVKITYHLTGSVAVMADTTAGTVSYNTGAGGDEVGPGFKTFTVSATDNRGFTGEATRQFQMNYSPDTWFAGPDTVAWDAHFGAPDHERYLDVIWHRLPNLPGTLLRCDSLIVRPAEHPAHKTFLEIYRDRLYVRTENDTVHMNSWVVVHGGGFDRDSPYHVLFASNEPGLGDTINCPTPLVLRPAGLVGSPIGFRSGLGMMLNPSGPFSAASQSLLFPNFDPASVFRAPRIAGYVPMLYSGKAYLVLRAADADGGRDGSVSSASVSRTIADRVDSGVGTPAEIALRSKILTFYVNRPPFLRTDLPGFVPKPNQRFSGRRLLLNLLAEDADPYDAANPPPFPGGPSRDTTLRRTVTLVGRDANGAQVDFSPFTKPVLTPQVEITVPQSLADSMVTVAVELCDCYHCDPGRGRCVNYEIPIQVPPATITGTLASLISAEALSDLVRIRWQLATARSARVERRENATPWSVMDEVLADGTGRATYEDRAVEPGRRYAYRLVLRDDRGEQGVAEVWVEVPNTTKLALDGLWPNPSTGGELTVRFSLAGAEPARLEMLDLSGRRVLARDLGSLGPGRHAINLGSGARIPPGVYLLRLTQGGNTRMARAAVLD